jgi:hypothetical protein
MISGRYGPGIIILSMGVTGAAVALSMPTLRSLIEQSMVWHMLVQMPLLVLGGWLSARALSDFPRARPRTTWNRYGLSAFFAAQSILAYWMLPVAIDRAVVLPVADLAKIISLFAGGFLLRHAMARSPALIQLFFVGSTVSMMAWLGTYFATVDRRLCNAYSLESQIAAGRGLMIVTFALALLWLVYAIRNPNRHMVADCARPCVQGTARIAEVDRRYDAP